MAFIRRNLLQYAAKRNFKNSAILANSNPATKWDSWYEEGLPKISVPVKMMKQIQKRQAKKELEAQKTKAFRGNGPLIISCKRSQYNHFFGHRYPRGKLNDKFLATQGWKHPKSAGDWMIFQPFLNLPAFHGTESSTFKTLNIWTEVTDVLKEMNITEPTYIQENGIPEIFSGSNVLIAAETGSGKTLTYLLPMLQNIKQVKSELKDTQQKNTPLGVVLLPSKELVYQVKSVCEELCKPLNLTVDIVCSGNHGPKKSKAVDIVIATPGAFAPLTYHKVYRLDHVQNLVLDEGDTLMDDSFSSSVKDIVNNINITTEVTTSRQTGSAQIVIVAATMPQDLKNILGDLMDMNAILTVKTPKLHHVLPHIKQRFERVKRSAKSDIVTEVIKTNHGRGRPTLVFCNGSSSACHLAYRLEDSHIQHSLLTGQLPERIRSGQFDSFQNGTNNILIATDIASRGLDTRHVKHVINYDFPNFMSDYLHRIGRVGRVGSPSKCMVSNYISQRWEVELLWEIERSIRKATALENVDANIKKSLVDRNRGEVESLLLEDIDDDDE